MPVNDSSMVIGAPAITGELELVITRANGEVENLGVVSYYHKNPIIQAKWEIEKFGEIKDETMQRIHEGIKAKVPYVLAGITALGFIGVAILRKLRRF